MQPGPSKSFMSGNNARAANLKGDDMEKPDRTDIMATAKYLRALPSEADAYKALLQFQKEWHERDLELISVSVRRNVEEIMQRLNVISR